jgi:hypothetical protein
MEKIPGFTPRRIAPGEDPQAFHDAEPRLHYFGCGTHREVLYPGEVATTFCPKCGPGDLSYDGWGEALRPSWRP